MIVELAPDLAPAHVRLAAVYLSSGRAPQAIEHLEAAVKLNPADEAARNALAQIRGQTPR